MRLQENGGTEKCEEAVVKALDYFQKTQAKDGSWAGGHTVGTTGLILLAYLGHCETPLSEKYGDTVLKAMTYLIDVGMQNDGKLIHKGGEKANSWVYEHCIATYALAEGYTFCKQLGVNVPNLEEVVQKAGQRIIDGQNPAGGWTYGFEESPTQRHLRDGLGHAGAQGLQAHRNRLPQHEFVHPQRARGDQGQPGIQRRHRLHRPAARRATAAPSPASASSATRCGTRAATRSPARAPRSSSTTSSASGTTRPPTSTATTTPPRR